MEKITQITKRNRICTIKKNNNKFESNLKPKLENYKREKRIQGK